MIYRTFITRVVLLAISVSLCGCQSFVKKFERKRLQEEKPDVVVIQPEEYAHSGASNQELYQQYYLFWKTWQDELIDSLVEKGSRKRQIDALRQALANLENLKLLLKPEFRTKLDASLTRLRLLQEEIAKDAYGARTDINRREAQRLGNEIENTFSFSRVKEDIL